MIGQPLPVVARLDDKKLRFISTISVTGTPTDMRLSEGAIKTFLFIDEATPKALLG